MSSKKLFKNGASMAVTQDHLKNQPRYITVDPDRTFLLFLEDGEDAGQELSRGAAEGPSICH